MPTWSVSGEGLILPCTHSHSLNVSSHWGERSSLVCLPLKALIPFMRAPSSWPDHLPKAPLPNVIILGVRIPTYEFDGVSFSPEQVSVFLEPLSSLFLHSSIHSLSALANHSVGCWSCFDGKHEPGTVCTFILLTICRDCVTLDRSPTSMSQCPPWGGMLVSPKSPSSTLS